MPIDLEEVERDGAEGFIDAILALPGLGITDCTEVAFAKGAGALAIGVTAFTAEMSNEEAISFILLNLIWSNFSV